MFYGQFVFRTNYKGDARTRMEWGRKEVSCRRELVAKLSGQEWTKDSLSMLCSALGGGEAHGGAKRANEHLV